jgi:Regulator of ribonuclease activity B
MGFLPRFGRKKPPPSPPELDQLNLLHLRGRGADLTKPRHILHFLYFAAEEDAGRATSAIEAAGYDVTLGAPDGNANRWSVRAETTRVVDESNVGAFRALFERVAAQHHGEYDGWEAAAEP